MVVSASLGELQTNLFTLNYGSKCTLIWPPQVEFSSSFKIPEFEGNSNSHLWDRLVSGEIINKHRRTIWVYSKFWLSSFSAIWGFFLILSISLFMSPSISLFSPSPFASLLHFPLSPVSMKVLPNLKGDILLITAGCASVTPNWQETVFQAGWV